MGDRVWAVQNDQNLDIFVANEKLLWVETRRAKGIRGWHASAAQRLRRGVYFLRPTYFTS